MALGFLKPGAARKKPLCPRLFYVTPSASRDCCFAGASIFGCGSAAVLISASFASLR
jgi:hypothetical protein